MAHIPVLQKEVIEYLDPKPNENFIDATFGEGGHALSILERTKPNGKLLGIEIDPELYEKIKSKISIINDQLSNRLILINDSYTNIKKITQEHNFRPINGILFDLGISSWHLEESRRGFSFKRDEPLDMRFNPQRNRLTAFEILNYWSKEKIEEILRKFGEEKFAKSIAKNIAEKRKIKPIRTTFDLVEIIKASLPLKYQRRLKTHPATRTFQALRIAVNNELENLEKTLHSLPRILEREARIVVISFHSLEDRIVKNFFRQKKREGILQILTPKPITPTFHEIISNPRSRSAKLRAAQIL
jgi:16S rRNA (cytosine1402-N4)-methyltransferase